ncbi:MAG: cell filamentation protein Fic [Puniceicoccaceae bacterium]|nr:MAG: cell filamentation protein Fic [Puniceicoccaceae bacterium]
MKIADQPVRKTLQDQGHSFEEVLSMAAKYDISAGIEGEFEPGSKGAVLKNLKGITTKAAVDELEILSLVEAQEHYLDRIDTETEFTAGLICQMHYDWLGEIYPWAGQYRTVDMSKDGFTWPPAHRVSENMAQFEATHLRANTPFRCENREEATLRLAAVHAELLLIHPFREGNGRIARWLSDLMCLQADLPQSDYGFTGKNSKQNRESYLQAVILGYECDYRALATFFREALERATTG